MIESNVLSARAESAKLLLALTSELDSLLKIAPTGLPRLMMFRAERIADTHSALERRKCLRALDVSASLLINCRDRWASGDNIDYERALEILEQISNAVMVIRQAPSV